jgi:serine/threonine-protein kinase
MIADDGAVKLTDFGIAKDLDATALTATGRTLGTAAYMAPEQIRGNPAVSHKTDLYSLGCVLFQLLTGSLPFKGGSAVALMHQHLSEPPPRPSTRNPQIPKALDNLILHLLAKSPTDRPWDAAAVAHKLTELRAKVDRGETVAMVFDTGDTGGNARSSMPLDSTQPATGRGGIVVTDGLSLTGSSGTGLRKATKKKKKSKGKTSGRSISNVSIWGTAGLVAGLIGVVALIAWQLVPPSAEKLFREAEKLMASSELSSWNQAEREFLGELEKRYPNHPYQAQVREWRDRSLLEQTRRRAEILEKSAIPSLREPKTEAEGLFVQVALAAREAVETRHEDTAATMWQQMADQLKAESGNEPRGWLLYAQQRVDEQTQIVARRRREAQTLLDQADSEEAVANHDLARRLRERMLDQYEKYPYLSDLVRQARLGLPASVAPDPAGNDPRAPAYPSPDP